MHEDLLIKCLSQPLESRQHDIFASFKYKHLHKFFSQPQAVKQLKCTTVCHRKYYSWKDWHEKYSYEEYIVVLQKKLFKYSANTEIKKIQFCNTKPSESQIPASLPLMADWNASVFCSMVFQSPTPKVLPLQNHLTTGQSSESSASQKVTLQKKWLAF